MNNKEIFWENNLHIPNITDEAGLEDFSGLEYYKQRILTIPWKSDFAIMPENTRNFNIDLEKIYKELGVNFINPENIFYISWENNISENILQNPELLEEIKAKSKWNFSNIFPFIHSENIDKINQILGLETSRTSKDSEKINDKSFAQTELRKLGVLVPEGKEVHNLEEAKKFFEYLQEKWYERVSIKLKRAASGKWVESATNLKEFEEKVLKWEKWMLEDGLLIDWWIQWKFISSPNIQFNIGKTPNEDRFIGCSDQILKNGTTHIWNISDNSILFENSRLREDLVKINNWIRSQKAYGIVGIDFAIFEDEDGNKNAYFMEINWRVNGSTHGNVLANRIYGEDYHDKWWVANSIDLPKNMTLNDFISKLERDGIYFNPDKKEWVLITNISTIEKFDKVMVAIFWNKDKILEIINILNSYHK